MLLTTPLVVTVGLSLTIPLSLVGEMVQYGQYSSMLYWVGAAVVVVSFLFINHESQDDKLAYFFVQHIRWTTSYTIMTQTWFLAIP